MAVTLPNDDIALSWRVAGHANNMVVDQRGGLHQPGVDIELVPAVDGEGTDNRYSTFGGATTEGVAVVR